MQKKMSNTPNKSFSSMITHMHKMSNNALNHWQACTKMSNKPIESFSSMITHMHKNVKQPVASFSKVHPGFWHALFHQEGTTLDSPTSMTQKFVELIRSAACTASQVPILMWQGGMQVCILVQRQVRAACPARAGTSQWPPTHSAIN